MKRCLPVCTVLICLHLSSACGAEEDAKPFSVSTPVKFRKTMLDEKFRSEGVAVADVNNDGKKDILCGEVWYQAPGWKMHEITTPGNYDGAKGYSQCFANFAMSVRGDGWQDSLIIGFPSKDALWWENPRGRDVPWKRHVISTNACNETPLFDDLLGNGKPVFVYPDSGFITWFSIPKDPEQHWETHVVSTNKAPGTKTYSHGLGIGDVNGDGRNDILVKEGWWEAPVDRTVSPWEFHPAAFGPDCANILVYDVNADGLPDVITSSAHKEGIWWFQQVRNGDKVEWKQQEIFAKLFSQSHAIILADINNDRVMDLVVGKRFWAHGPKGDIDPNKPAVLYWIELQRGGNGEAKWLPHLIDDNSGVGTQFQVADINGDGRLDIAVSNKKGASIFMQE